MTPASYAFSGTERSEWASYVYTDRPVYQARAQGSLESDSAAARWRIIWRLPKPQQHACDGSADQEDHAVLEKDMPICADGYR